MNNPQSPAPLTGWIVTDGKIGMVNQCRGLAAALGLDAREITIDLAWPWRLLPPLLIPAYRAVVGAGHSELRAPWPDVLIASGRKSVAPALAVRRASNGHTFCVQIQDPGVAANRFDLVVAPAHDGLTGDNVVVTAGSMHGVTEVVLANARSEFEAMLSPLKRPLATVLLGGDNAVYRMSEAVSARLAADLAKLADSGYSLAVTPSRRTPEHAMAAIRAALAGKQALIWSGAGDNPYFGFLAHADAIIVTGDSVNMVSEAAATGKPVYVVDLEGGSGKFSRFHDAMRSAGHTRPFAGKIEQWDHGIPDDTARAAAEIHRRLAQRSR